jgi:hypothetical protein
VTACRIFVDKIPRTLCSASKYFSKCQTRVTCYGLNEPR